MRYLFGEYELDAAQRELRRDIDRIDVQPLVLELLLYLVCHRERVVPKDELLNALWADSTVTEASLLRAVSLARRAIGDTDRRAPLIRNHPRLGYRFAAEVEEAASAPHPASAADATVPVQSSYAQADGTHIAYQVVGQGPVDLVVVHGWTLSMQSIWDDPYASRFHRRLAESARLILFDKRGTGLSDRVKELPGLAQRMEDLTAVLDAVGSKSAYVLGISEGAPMSILYAASHPDRVLGLGLVGGFARMRRDAGQSFGWTDEDVKRLDGYIRTRWGEGSSQAAAMASQLSRPESLEWAARAEQIGGSPGAALELWSMNQSIDVRSVLPVLQTPCLVLHTSDDPVIDVEHGRHLARSIADARYVELDGIDHVPFYPPIDEPALEAIEGWLGDERARPAAQRRLATLLLTDLPIDEGSGVDSELQQLVIAHRGQLVSVPSGRMAAMFEGPALGIRGALAIRDAVTVSGAELRCALHCSEIECRPPASGEARTASGPAPMAVVGSAVDEAALLLAQVEAGDVLVPRTLRELVVGSGLEFQPRGEIQIPGEVEPRPLFAVSL